MMAYLLFIMDAVFSTLVSNEWCGMNTTAIRLSTWAGILIAFYKLDLWPSSLPFLNLIYKKEVIAYLAGGIED